jgi:hypothetical protein
VFLKMSKKISGSLSGAAGVHFVSGELCRRGNIALQTVKNTKGIDIVVSNSDFTKTAYLQVKTNANKYDFWLVNKPKVGENTFYVFVNLLSKQKNQRPEYYIVSSSKVQAEYERFERAKKNVNPTPDEIEKVIQGINQGKTAWSLVYDLGVSIRAVREIAEQLGITIKFDRRPADKGQGEKFPFSFYIREANKETYRDNWEQIFG